MSALAERDLDDVRSFAVENYVIYYRQEGDVLIARILHGRCDQMAAWSESS